MKSLKMSGAAALLALFALTGATRAAGIDDLVRETQRIVVEENQVSMVWWMPLEFWSETIRGNPDLNAEARSELVSMMADYTVIALMRATPGAEGLEKIQPKAELLKNTKVEYDGKVLTPVPDDKIAPTANLVLSQLKPVLAQAAGAVGQALEFAVYPSKVDGKPIDAGMAGRLAVTFYGRPQNWRLPLGSVLPPKTDKATGESFPGNFEYNPFTGKKIEVAK
jgi:hypothetical protein